MIHKQIQNKQTNKKQVRNKEKGPSTDQNQSSLAYDLYSYVNTFKTR